MNDLKQTDKVTNIPVWLNLIINLHSTFFLKKHNSKFPLMRFN
jgi:hypothetical protein